ncbi:MAG: hypothetical protein K2X09_05265, partial [Rickettsiales bacterium]|nr:hypothetical protein [Rickettsiales bacterium]
KQTLYQLSYIPTLSKTGGFTKRIVWHRQVGKQIFSRLRPAAQANRCKASRIIVVMLGVMLGFSRIFVWDLALYSFVLFRVQASIKFASVRSGFAPR